MSRTAGRAARPVAGPVRHLLSILALPFMNTVVIPAALLVTVGDIRQFAERVAPGGPAAFVAMIAGALILAAGIALVVTSIGLFATRGEGTLAPWDPPRKLVIAGPYRYIRNPMKAGLIIVLIGEALLLRSWLIAGWCATFATVNVIYILLSEEPGLRRRFGDSYVRYCAMVPSWIPRLPAHPQPGNRVERTLS